MATNAPSSSSPSLSTGCVSTPITLLEIPSSISEELSVTTNITAAQKGIPSDYVFGSNISSRVVNADVTRGASSSLWTSTSKDQDSASSVFTTLAKAVTASQTNCKEVKNLEDSAKEVAEDKRRETLTLAEVDLVTGEEGELSIIRQHCRAYIFDANTQKWNNLGAVHFHLNDIPNDSVQGNSNSSSRSRIVVRLASTRKLVINTLIWSQMPVALVDSRTLRIGAINDEGHIKNYLFAFPPDESASRIYDMLISRKKSTTVACPQEICDKQSSTSNKDKLAGCKRQAETQITSDTNHLPLASPKIANTNILPPAANLVVFPKTNIFRPSIFSPACNDLSNNPSVLNSSDHTGELQFRNSPLDNVVKRLCEGASSSGMCERPTFSTNNKVVEPPKLSSSVTSQCMPISSFSNDRCGNFIFGHNVSERVTNASSSTTVNNDISEKHAPGESLELGTSISPEKEYTDASEVGEHCATLPSKQTLEESAAAVASEMLEKSTYLSANLQESPILTGEEGEYLSLKAYCHFYCFDRHKHEWAGRGQAYIHLNDVAMKSPCSQNQTSTPPSGPPARSRVVIRTCQTLKLLANVPVWSGLKVAMVDERSVRLTTVCHPSENLCDSQIKPSCLTDSIVTKPEFCAYLLVMHSQKEADRLFKALNSRIATFNSRQNAKLTDINETNSASSSPEDFSPLQSCEHIHLEDGDDSGFVNKIGREIVKTNAKSGINELSTSGDREVSLLTSTTDSS